MDRTDTLKCLAEGDPEKICLLLKKSRPASLLKLIRTEALKNSNGTCPSLRALFQGSRGTDESMVEQHFVIFQSTLNLLKESSLSSQMISNLLGLLLLEVQYLEPYKLIILVDEFISSFEKGDPLENKWIEVFPKIFTSVTSFSIIKLEDEEETLSGLQYRRRILSKIISFRWKDGIAHLASIFRDMMLTEEELHSVVKKCLSSLDEMHISDIPPFVYQLLELSSKGQQMTVLEGIMKFFNDKDKKMIVNPDEESEFVDVNDTHDILLATEGTVIHHISSAAKAHLSLSRELIRMLKNYKTNLEDVFLPFSLAVSLSLASGQRYNDQIISTLKSAVMQHYQEKHLKLSSFWICGLVKNQLDITQLILTTIQHSKSGWEYITEGLIEFGLALVDSCKTHIQIDMVEYALPQERTAVLGHLVLKETFKVHVYVRDMILEKVLKRILPLRSSTSACNRNYIDILTAILAVGPQTALASVQKLKSTLEYLPDFEVSTAVALILALMPLLKKSLTLMDSLMLTLRKAMFSRNSEPRKMAVNGYILILKNFKVLGGISLSQDSESSVISVSQYMVEINLPRCNKVANEALCIDLLNILSRSLTQQEAVRTVVYKGLPSVMLHNKQLSEDILNMLWMKFEQFYEPVVEASPPMRLSSCIAIQMDEAVLLEPIGDLVWCISICISTALPLADHLELPDNGPLQKLNGTIQTLVRRMSDVELEDFKLDKSSDFGNASVGTKNQILARQLMAIYEVLIEFTFVSGNMSKGSCESILALLKVHKRLGDALKGGNKKKLAEGKVGRGRKGFDIKDRPSMISLKTLADLMFAIFSGTSLDVIEGRNLLKKDEALARYLLQTVAEKIGELQEENFIELSSRDSLASCTQMALIARILMRVYSMEYEPIPETEGGNKTEHPTPLSLICLELLSDITGFYRHKSPHLLSKFLIDFRSQGSTSMSLSGDGSYTNLVLTFLKKFQKMVLLLLSEEDKDVRKGSLKASVPVMTFLQDLSSFQIESSKNDTAENMFAWIRKQCAQLNIDDVTTSRKMVTVALQIGQQVEGGDELMKELAVSNRVTLGDFNAERSALEEPNPLALVNKKNGLQISSILLSNLEQIIREIDWVLGILSSNDSRESFEKAICKRLSLVIDVCYHMLHTSLPQNSNYEHLFQFISKVYRTLTAFSKHYVVLYNQKCGKLGSNFEKLVKHSGDHLTPNVYILISHVQGYHEDSRKKAKLDLEKQQAKVVKSKLPISSVIFCIERYEETLILLSKKSKVDLMIHFKASTARDFRIKYDLIAEDLNVDDEEEPGSPDPGPSAQPMSNLQRLSQIGTPIARRGGLRGKRKK